MSDVIAEPRDPQTDEWKTYDDFADGIETYRLPNVDLTGQSLALTLSDGSHLELEFVDVSTCRWQASGAVDAAPGTLDPYDAVAVREDVFFVNLELTSRQREAVTIVFRRATGRALVAVSTIAAEATEGVPQVSQRFLSGVVDGEAVDGGLVDGEAVEGGHPPTVSGSEPAPSRDLIGKRNLYRYSPSHLYEHMYVSSERYAWQCLEGVQRGHGDMDLSTVWKFDDGLYLFCFREFRIAVASVWLHDLGYELRTTGIFLGLNAEGESMHSRAGGHIYPLGAVAYPDSTPV